MKPERWQQVKRLFDAALEKNSSDRAAFLDEMCSADSELRNEVQSLLDNCADDSFLETPAYPLKSRPPDMPAPKELGPYEIIEEIGRGGMGIVFLARDRRLDRRVAIKMLPPEYTTVAEYRERLKREARAAARLTHAGIATVYSLEEFGNSLCIVSEYVQGPTLSALMDASDLPFHQVLDIAVQTARALTAAHQDGIIHRDLKPQNIVVTDSGVVKILDFGLARIAPQPDSTNQRLTRSGMFLGTPAYASPEQLMGLETDSRTDIFSFGVLLYEMAAGRHPFGAADAMSTIARILDGNAPALMSFNPEIPEEFDRIVGRCLQKRPSDRYGSTRELLEDLERLRSAPGMISNPAKSERRTSALWWWQFHQACAAFGYYGMLYPMWRVKQWLGGIEGSLLFFPTLIAVGIAANLRFHLWFTSGFYNSELSYQRQKVAPWIRSADCLFVIMLAASAIRIHTLHAIIATLLMAVAVGSLVAFALIEPTTTRAALGKSSNQLNQ